MRPRLSVVVPVYNVEDYLDDCLSSLEAQTSHDFEAVCVNDGSTDASGEILSRWSKEHDWVRVVTKKNGGLSSARNAGIRAARGTYVCFLDSDDRLLPSACQRIAEALGDDSLDVLVYGGHALPRDATWDWLENALSPEAATYEGYSDELVFGEKTRPFAWRVAAKTSFLLGETGSEVLFDERVRYGEDQVFQFYVYALSRRTKVIEDRLYEYRVNRPGSLMSDARMDMADLLCSHVEIMSYVLHDFSRLQVLQKCSGSMLTWLVRFIALDALDLDAGGCAKVFSALGPLVEDYWTSEDIKRATLAHPVRKTLMACLNQKVPPTPVRRALALDLRRVLFQSGGSLARRVVRALRRRS